MDFLMTVSEAQAAFPDRPEDDEGVRKLKHQYRFGVIFGLINPDTVSAKTLWADIEECSK